MSSEGEGAEDWRYAELRRLGDAERRLSVELADARDQIARLVTQMLPAHAPAVRIDSVAAASGYSRWPVDQLRRGRLWLR